MHRRPRTFRIISGCSWTPRSAVAGHSFEAAKLIGRRRHCSSASTRTRWRSLPPPRSSSRLPDERSSRARASARQLRRPSTSCSSSREVPGVDAILFDLGVSSVQIDTPSRGFSFKENGPLDMRMDPGKQTLTAAEIVNTYNAADLTRIIRSYSDEKWASRIADFIVKARGGRSDNRRVSQLVDVIKAAIPASARRAGGHPAKRTFQALRIEVNSELDRAASRPRRGRPLAQSGRQSSR